MSVYSVNMKINCEIDVKCNLDVKDYLSYGEKSSDESMFFLNYLLSPFPIQIILIDVMFSEEDY